MPYVLRFVQRYRISEDRAFMDVERQFAALEKRGPGSTHPRRMRSIAGREPCHTLVWECEFPTLAELHTSLEGLAGDPEHTRLLALQSPMMLEAYTEIYEVLDL